MTYSSVQTSISSKLGSQFAFDYLCTYPANPIPSQILKFYGFVVYIFYLSFNNGLDSLKGALITSLIKQGNISEPAKL